MRFRHIGFGIVGSKASLGFGLRGLGVLGFRVVGVETLQNCRICTALRGASGLRV